MRLSAACLLLPLLLLSACATFEPEDLHRVQAYDGATLPQDRVATLFTTDGRPHAESATMCRIDDASLEHDGVCASVAYVLPGRHVVHLRYASPQQLANETAVVVVAEPGRLYQLNFSSLGRYASGLVTVIPMGSNARLSWRNLAPGLAAGSPRIDEVVPYAANAQRAAPRPDAPLTPDERAVADRLFVCAADYSISVDLLKAGHANPDPANEQRMEFVGIAHEYMSEAALQAALGAARARVRSDYAAAFDPAPSATAAQAAAVERLEADMHACQVFRRYHATDFLARRDKHAAP